MAKTPRKKVRTKAHYEARAVVAQAMGHPARMLVLDVLAENGECCVCELTELIGSEMPTVSRHLAVLKNAGLIRDDKRGKNVYYSLNCPCLGAFFSCIEEVLKKTADKHARSIK